MSDPSDVVNAIRARALRRADLAGPETPTGTSSLDPKESVLDAAAALLVELGFAEVTLDKVAARAGVPKGKLLELCLSREELFFQVLGREVDRCNAALRELIQPDVPAMELMRALSETGFSYVSGRPLLLQLMLGEAADAMPSWAERLDELRQRLLQLPRQVVQVGMEQEILRPDLPAELIAGLLFEIHVAGYLLHKHEGPQAKLRAAQRRAAVLEILYNGLRRRAR